MKLISTITATMSAFCFLILIANGLLFIYNISPLGAIALLGIFLFIVTIIIEIETIEKL
jgi:membrane-bound ClpP family serine protease